MDLRDRIRHIVQNADHINGRKSLQIGFVKYVNKMFFPSSGIVRVDRAEHALWGNTGCVCTGGGSKIMLIKESLLRKH